MCQSRINYYAYFDNDKIVISDFFQLTESKYEYKDIEAIKTAPLDYCCGSPNSKIEQKPDLLIIGIVPAQKYFSSILALQVCCHCLSLMFSQISQPVTIHYTIATENR